jgi:hypothetical protein|tara:strand:- start:318 stop:449 length:132 start_codon:yes stop_codon:yes gene_type:complete
MVFLGIIMDDIESIEEEEKPNRFTQIIIVLAVVIMVMVFFLGM